MPPTRTSRSTTKAQRKRQTTLDFAVFSSPAANSPSHHRPNPTPFRRSTAPILATIGASTPSYPPASTSNTRSRKSNPTDRSIQVLPSSPARRQLRSFVPLSDADVDNTIDVPPPQALSSPIPSPAAPPHTTDTASRSTFTPNRNSRGGRRPVQSRLTADSFSRGRVLNADASRRRRLGLESSSSSGGSEGEMEVVEVPRPQSRARPRSISTTTSGTARTKARLEREDYEVFSDISSGPSEPALAPPPPPPQATFTNTPRRRPAKKLILLDTSSSGNDSNYELETEPEPPRKRLRSSGNINEDQLRLTRRPPQTRIPSTSPRTPNTKLVLAAVMVESPKKGAEYVRVGSSGAGARSSRISRLPQTPATRAISIEDDSDDVVLSSRRKGKSRMLEKGKRIQGGSARSLWFDASDDYRDGGEKQRVSTNPHSSDNKPGNKMPFSQSTDSTDNSQGSKHRVDDDEEDSLPILSSARRRKRLHRTTSSGSLELPEQPRSGHADLSDDDLELVSSSRVLSSRTRYGSSPKKLSRFQRGLAKLRAKRDGLDDEEVPERTSPVNTSGEEEEEEEVESGSRRGKRNQHSHISISSSGADDNDDDAHSIVSTDSFIVDDGDANVLIGAPLTINNLSHPNPYNPLSQSILPQGMTYQNQKSNFKIIIQWMVHKLLLYRSKVSQLSPSSSHSHCPPSSQLNTPYFKDAFHAIDRRIDSLRDGFKSEAWKGPFWAALRHHPTMKSVHKGSGSLLEDHCVACNNRERHASWTVWFGGKMYDRETLEDYDDRDEEEDDSRGSSPVVDDRGVAVPPPSTSFALGRFCFERAEITHQFWHWKKEQYELVAKELESLGWADERRRREAVSGSGGDGVGWADGVMQGLEEMGTVEIWYRQFKAMEERGKGFVGGGSRRRF